jgi:hypothetical protein
MGFLESVKIHTIGRALERFSVSRFLQDPLVTESLWFKLDSQRNFLIHLKISTKNK